MTQVSNIKLKAAGALIFLIGVPVVLLALPSDFFDQGQSLCISKLLFDVECPGCGLTRACQHLIHFEFDEAAYHNPWSFVAFPALAYFWVVWTLDNWRKFRR